MAKFYLAAVQAILLYCSETWTITQQQLQLLETFHHQCLRQIAHKHIHPLPNGEWETLATTTILETTGLKSIETYIQQQCSHILEYIKKLPIYQKCKQVTPITTTA